MGAKQEAQVLELLELFHADNFTPNLARAASLFAEDASYQIQVPSRPPVYGRDAIVAELSRQALDYKDCECEILTVVSNDRTVVTERVDHVTMLHNDVRVSNPLLAIFELNDDGLIVAWREYWDALSLCGRMGVSPEDMAQLIGIQ
jgi:limonene-1,2-epoxide hydrolase